MPGKILIVEDETKIARTVRLYLEQAGFQVTMIHDGALAMPAFRHEQPDLIVLDLMLPNVDGLDVCRQIRRTSNVPIIMFTARSEEADTLIGLELGADDYITKPFSPREVVARVRAVLRRAQGPEQTVSLLAESDVQVDLDRHVATIGGTPIELTPIEFNLLVAFVRQPGRAFTRLQLLEAVGDPAYDGYERTIDQHIKNLRSKLGDDARDPRHILTVYGVGYKFIADEADDA